MLKCFKPTEYLLNLTPEQVINKFKATTNSYGRLNNANAEFKGEFTENTFKLQFVGNGSVLIKDSYKPVFLGKTTQEKNGTRLSVKMQMNWAGYLMILLPLLIWLVSVLYMLLSDKTALEIFVSSSFLLIVFIALVCTISISKYKDMRETIKMTFEDYIISMKI